MHVIDIRALTKDYGSGKGVFDVTFRVEPGEVYGYLGPNGAGKSTTMRHLMGFVKPQSGQVMMEGRDCWKDRRIIQKKVGYLPGEIAFPEDMTGKSYLKLIGRMRKMKDFSRAGELLEILELCTLSSSDRKIEYQVSGGLYAGSVRFSLCDDKRVHS